MSGLTGSPTQRERQERPGRPGSRSGRSGRSGRGAAGAAGAETPSRPAAVSATTTGRVAPVPSSEADVGAGPGGAGEAAGGTCPDAGGCAGARWLRTTRRHARVRRTPPEQGFRVQRAGDGAVVDATPRALPDGPTAPGHAASDDVPDAPHGGSGHPPSRVRRRSPFPLLAYGRHTFTASPSRASRWQAAGRSPADIGTSDRMVAGHDRMVARRHVTREPFRAHPWRCGPYRLGATGGLAAGATLLDAGTARAP